MKIETKYEVGEMVWAIHLGKPKRKKILQIDTNSFGNYNKMAHSNIFYILDFYNMEENKFKEEDVYRTKEELLDWLSKWS